MKSEFRIRKVNEDDYLILAELGARLFYETWRPVNTEEDMQIYISKAFDAQNMRSEIANESVNTFFLAFDGEKPVGYAKLRRDRTYNEFNGQQVIELERIYVDKNWQDKYVGRALMNECLLLANNQQYEWFWLGVNIDNIKAISFYKKYGFTIFGEKAFKLGDAIDNDYLMKLKLPFELK